MQRRQFIQFALAGMAMSSLPSLFINAHAATNLSVSGAIAELKAMRITSTALVNSSTGVSKNYSGALMLAPYGMLNWYFNNLSLLFAFDSLNDTDAYMLVSAYLDCYLRNVESSNIIYDVEFPTWNYTTNQPTSWRTPTRNRDSDDAYAATFVALVARFVTRFTNHATYGASVATWWNNKKAQIKSIAYLNILVPLKPTGLTPTFRPDLPIPPHIAQDPNYPTYAAQYAACQVGYLMDNCEVYFGLAKLSALLQAKQDTDASYFAGFLPNIGAGIASLYKATSSAYRESDATTTIDTHFYPGAVCQIYPLVFEVTPEITNGHAVTAWGYFTSKAGTWYNWPNGGTGSTNKPDVYPWAVIAYGVGLRQARQADATLLTNARKLVTQIETNFPLANQRPYITINELGFYLAAKRVV